eukprot:314002_1
MHDNNKKNASLSAKVSCGITQAHRIMKREMKLSQFRLLCAIRSGHTDKARAHDKLIRDDSCTECSTPDMNVQDDFDHKIWHCKRNEENRIIFNTSSANNIDEWNLKDLIYPIQEELLDTRQDEVFDALMEKRIQRIQSVLPLFNGDIL